jgi:hypothetical protein
MITRFFTDRLTIAALALTAILPFAAVTPVQAGTNSCAVQAEQLRSQAASASPQDAAKALRSISIAEKICAEGNSHEAAKKFAAARTALAGNVQLAERR